MNRSYLVAAFLTLGITAWVVGGYMLKTPDRETGAAAAAAETAAKPMTVAVRTQDARPVQQHIVAQGQAEPNRTVTVRAETSGQIAEILRDEGATVAAGDAIARLKPNDRRATLARAKARVQEQKSAYEASRKLGKKGYQTQRRSDETYSALQTAKAELEAARIDLDHATIRAPFEGTVLTSQIELGSYVEVNGEVATIVDNDPLVVRVNIAQQDISRVKLAHPTSVLFATGQKRDGKVRYVAARADEGTRTFRVEIEVPNPNGEIPSGISAEAKIPTGSALAYFVSPAALALNDEGVLGVKTVDENDKVVFNAVAIVRSDRKGVWLTGPEKHARIITVGQGFVRVGETVRAVEESGAQDASSAAVSDSMTETDLREARR